MVVNNTGEPVVPPPLHPHYMTVLDPSTGQYFHLKPPPTEERDAALGRLMDAFSTLESTLFLNFALMFGVPHNDVREVLYNILDAQSLRNALSSLSKIRLNKDGQDALDRILARAKNATSKRNKIVHGDWHCEFTYYGEKKPDAPFFVEWVRNYHPTSPIEREELAKPQPNQKIKAKFCFNTKALNRITSDVTKLLEDLGDFHGIYRDQFPKQPPELPQQLRVV